MKVQPAFASWLAIALAFFPTAEATETTTETTEPTGGSELEANILDIEATILDVSATILDLDSGTATTEAPEQVTITLEADVFFDFDQADLRPDAQATLAEVVEQIRQDGATELHIAGHTDSIGSAEYNQDLSERRARSVEAFLIEQLEGVTTIVEGFGFTQPVAPNETAGGEDYPEGRELNRRVEISYPRS